MKLKDYHQYVNKVDGSGRLTVRNRNCLGKFNPPVYKSLSSIPYPRKANIPLQKFVFSGNGEKKIFKENFDVQPFQKVISDETEDKYSKIYHAKPASFLLAEDSNFKGVSQSSTKRRNGVWSRLDPNNKPGLSEIYFVDDGVTPKNALRRYGCVEP